eukprot:500021_1
MNGHKLIKYGLSGGGAVYLKCKYGKFVNKGRIKVNGNGYDQDTINLNVFGGGCGSGGSIKIECNEFKFKKTSFNSLWCLPLKNMSYISVCGGNDNDKKYRNGGIGRMC